MCLKSRLPQYSLGVLVLILLGVSYGCGPNPQVKKAAHMQKGAAYLAQGKYAEAILEFRNAAAADANDAQVHYQLGLASLKKGELVDLREAFRAFKKTVELDATNLDAQIQLSKLYLPGKKLRRSAGTSPEHTPAAASVCRCLCYIRTDLCGEARAAQRYYRHPDRHATRSQTSRYIPLLGETLSAQQRPWDG